MHEKYFYLNTYCVLEILFKLMHLYLPIYKLKIFFYESDNNLPITKFVIRVIQIYNLIYYRTSRMGATIGDLLSRVFFFIGIHFSCQ